MLAAFGCGKRTSKIWNRYTVPEEDFIIIRNPEQTYEMLKKVYKAK